MSALSCNPRSLCIAYSTRWNWVFWLASVVVLLFNAPLLWSGNDQHEGESQDHRHLCHWRAAGEMARMQRAALRAYGKTMESAFGESKLPPRYVSKWLIPNSGILEQCILLHSRNYGILDIFLISGNILELFIAFGILELFRVLIFLQLLGEYRSLIAPESYVLSIWHVADHFGHGAERLGGLPWNEKARSRITKQLQAVEMGSRGVSVTVELQVLPRIDVDWRVLLRCVHKPNPSPSELDDAILHLLYVVLRNWIQLKKWVLVLHLVYIILLFCFEEWLCSLLLLVERWASGDSFTDQGQQLCLFRSSKMTLVPLGAFGLFSLSLCLFARDSSCVMMAYNPLWHYSFRVDGTPPDNCAF